MAKPMSYAARRALESLPVVDGQQYRVEEVKRLDETCAGCAASNGGNLPSTHLCEQLPECTKSKRLDGRNVVFVDCGKAVR